MLALLGLSVAATKALKPRARRRAFVIVALGVLLVTIPLAAATSNVYQQSLIKGEAAQLAQEWLEGADYGIDRVTVSGDQVELVIYGSGDRPPLFELGSRLDASFDQPVNLSLVVVPSEQEDYVAGGR